MTEAELIEALAAIEHTRWADWQEYFFAKCGKDDDGNLIVPAGYVASLRELIAKPYADLIEGQKQHDRDEVRRYLHLIREYAQYVTPEMRT